MDRLCWRKGDGKDIFATRIHRCARMEQWCVQWVQLPDRYPKHEYKTLKKFQKKLSVWAVSRSWCVNIEKCFELTDQVICEKFSKTAYCKSETQRRRLAISNSWGEKKILLFCARNMCIHKKGRTLGAHPWGGLHTSIFNSTGRCHAAPPRRSLPCIRRL